MIKKIISIFALIIILLLLYGYFSNKGWITFSDSAKLSDVSRNLLRNKSLTSDYSNYVISLTETNTITNVSKWIPPVAPIIIAGFFKLFGVSDISVIIFSSFFFILSAIMLFLISRKIFGEFTGYLTVLAFVFNLNFLDYATSGASEVLLLFEIFLIGYLFLLKQKRASLIGFIVLIILYFTKAQSIIYMFSLVLLFLLINFPYRKALSYFGVIFAIGGVLFLLFSKQGIFAVTQHMPGMAVSDSLRGGLLDINLINIVKKVFYNLYNFYRLMPQIMSPYLWALFLVGLFGWCKNERENAFKISVVFMVILTFFVTALTIPFFRYIHPVVPFVYIIAVATLVRIIEKISNIEKKQVVAVVSAFLVFTFAVAQTLGVIFLDSRFEKKIKNFGKPPIYAKLSWLLRDSTDKDSLIITNLDTWGSWYGERKTVWFPLKPNMLINPQSGEIPFDAIYLTNYLMDDENYYMGAEWRDVFLNPQSHNQKVISDNFNFAGNFSISASENYENMEGRAVLFLKK